MLRHGQRMSRCHRHRPQQPESGIARWTTGSTGCGGALVLAHAALEEAWIPPFNFTAVKRLDLLSYPTNEEQVMT